MKQIDDKYAALGGVGGFLGKPKSPATRCPDQAGWFRHYTGGSIYWHAETGAHVVYGEIYKKWASLGWENSWLGYPVSDEEPHGDGRRSRFQNGVITYDAKRGARDLEGVGCAVYFRSSIEEHKKQIAVEQAKKRRLVALSIFGKLKTFGNMIDVHLASVWTSHPGPEQKFITGVTEDAYRSWADKNKALGFHTTILAVEPVVAGGNVFAAAAEKVSGSAPVAKYDLRLTGSAADDKTLAYWTDWARKNRYLPSGLDLYDGGDGAPRAVIVLTPNPGRIAWNWNSLVQGKDRRARHYEIHTTHGERPALTTRLVNDTRLTLYREDHVGFWYSKGNLTESEARKETDKAAAAGKYPISLSGDQNGRYTAIWASRKDPLPNRWAITGQEVPELAAVEEAVKKHMVNNNIRSASVAVGKDHRLVYARTLTWAPPTYPIATPKHIFRVGSVSKVFTAMVANQLIDEQRVDPGTNKPLTLDSRMLTTLGISSTNTKLAAGTKAITLRQLLNHTSRLADRDTNSERNDVIKLSGTSFADSSKRDCVRYLVGFDLKPEPDYTNNGYVAAGAVVEAVDTVNGKPRSNFDSIRARILDPLGLARPAVSGWALSTKIPWSVHQHTVMLDIGANVMLNDGTETRIGYENYSPTHGEACGSLAFSAADMVKMLTSFTCGKGKNPILSEQAIANMWPASDPPNGFLRNWNPPPGYDQVFWHNGAVAGGHAIFALYRNDDGDSGASICTLYNRDGEDDHPNWDPIIAGIKSWPTHDLFDSVGTPPHKLGG